MATEGFAGKAQAWRPELPREAAPPIAWLLTLIFFVMEAVVVAALVWLLG